MKRFWTEASAVATREGHAIHLDGRPLRTQGGLALVVPGAALAQAIAAEWQAAPADFSAGDLPLTGLANAALDIVAVDIAGFAAGLAAYAGHDLTCYRAAGPQPLVARQVAAWEPPLKAVEAAHGLVFRRTAGVVPVEQPGATLAAVARLLAAQDPFTLAALSPLVTLSGSAVLALALLGGHVDADSAWQAAEVDEAFQAEHWGADPQAEAVRAARAAAFRNAARFLSLHQKGA